MRVLILGGTAFVGRAVTEDALRSGLDVTLFHRGRTGSALFPDVPRIIGDRGTGDYSGLSSHAGTSTSTWDAVIDCSGYLPRQITEAADALGDRGGRYLFVSSHAVYARSGHEPGADEDAPLLEPLHGVETLDGTSYGRSKVACEQVVLARHERATIVRPGKVVGPNDVDDDFPYWVRRAARGGRVALPGEPDQPVQVVDVRDLARLVVRLVTDDRGGTFNAVGPAQPTTLAELVRTCARVADREVEIVPVPPDPTAPMFPLVRNYHAGQQRSSAKARAAGLPATPLAVTAADTLAWDRERGEPPLSVGLTAEAEAELLKPRRRERP